MDHILQMIQEFEHFAVHLCISIATISAIARWAWGEELKKWRSRK